MQPGSRNEPIEPETPLIVEELDEKFMVPKSVTGKTPLEFDGASAIHSADTRDAAMVVLVLKWPPLPFEMVTVKAPVVAE